jgi:SAM-dependent methyltransferase
MSETPKDIRDYNRDAWDREVTKGNRWTVPVSPEDIARARRGDWDIVLTPTIPVPKDWFAPLAGADVLCLASGGGQQGPILAAAGARVTVLDNSPAQLARDTEVAAREGLDVTTVEGDMLDLGRFPDANFDLIFHPVSNVFVPDVLPLWRECFRVLRPGGVLLAYSDLTHLDAAVLRKRYDDLEPLEFSHTLEEQIGGQLAAGFVITGYFEDRYSTSPEDPVPGYMTTCIATRAVKPA